LLPFTSISYDPHHDQVFITLGGISSRYPAHLTHMVEQPRVVNSVLVTSGDKTERLLTLRRQPQLEA
jgi:hypothetical protein